MPQPKAGPNIKLVPYDKTYVSFLSAWYYDFRYEAFFRDCPDQVLGDQELEEFGSMYRRVGGELLVAVDKKTGNPLGLMTYQMIRTKSRVFRFGIMLDESVQHKSVAVETILLLMYHLFSDHNCRKLVVEFLRKDEHIGRITEKGGFIHEATIVQEAFVEGECQDELRYYYFKDAFYTRYKDFIEMVNGLEENKAP